VHLLLSFCSLSALPLSLFASIILFSSALLIFHPYHTPPLPSFTVLLLQPSPPPLPSSILTFHHHSPPPSFPFSTLSSGLTKADDSIPRGRFLFLVCGFATIVSGINSGILHLALLYSLLSSLLPSLLSSPLFSPPLSSLLPSLLLYLLSCSLAILTCEDYQMLHVRI
jgi:hypothetical protein